MSAGSIFPGWKETRQSGTDGAAAPFSTGKAAAAAAAAAAASQAEEDPLVTGFRLWDAAVGEPDLAPSSGCPCQALKDFPGCRACQNQRELQ